MSLKLARFSTQQPGIGKLVRELRQVMKLSHKQFADELGMTFPSINRWENGHATPFPFALQRIDTLLNQLGSSDDALRTKYIPVGKAKT